CHSHSSGRGHATCHRGRAVASIGDNSIGDSHGIGKGRRAGSGPSDDDDAPSAIKTATCQRWTGKDKAGEKQETNLDPETAVEHGDLPSSFVSIADAQQLSEPRSSSRSPGVLVLWPYPAAIALTAHGVSYGYFVDGRRGEMRKNVVISRAAFTTANWAIHQDGSEGKTRTVSSAVGCGASECPLWVKTGHRS